MLRRSVCEEEEEAGALKAAERLPGLQRLPRRPWDVDFRAWRARLEETPPAREERTSRPQGVSAVARGNAFSRTPHTVGGGQGAGGPGTSSRPSTPLQHTRRSRWLEPAHATRRHQTPAHA